MDVDLYIEFLEKSHKQQKVMIEMLRKQLQEQNQLRENAEQELRLVTRNFKKKAKA